MHEECLGIIFSLVSYTFSVPVNFCGGEFCITQLKKFEM